MQEEVNIGGSKDGIPCDECGLVTRCYVADDSLGNHNWYCFSCLKFIYGVKK